MEKFIIANDTALRISDSGKGEVTLLFLHGYLESLGVWEEFTAPMTRVARVIAIDIPGHGISQVKGEIHTMEFLSDVIVGVLDKLGVAKVYVIGHSMGGYVAEAFAAKYTDRVEGIVLFHSTPNADSAEKKQNREREIEMVQADKKTLIVNMFAPKGFAEQNRRRLSGVIRQFEEMMLINEDEGIIALLRGMMERADMNEAMRKLPIPQLFIFGMHDEFIPVEAAEALAAAHPQAQVAWLENSGHMGFVEEPMPARDIILNFVGLTLPEPLKQA